MSKVEIQKINKVFLDGKREIKALDDISLSIEENELAVIVGPSGCGKSTLLNIAAGLEKATSGKIMMNQQEVQGPGADRGMVFQSYTLFPWLTVQKNVEFGLAIKGLKQKQREEIAWQYLQMVKLEDFAKLYPKALSGGMKQRVAIARALANEPRVLLMDEPFGALDAQTRVVMQELLLRIWEKSQKTVLFITHDIDEAIFLADKIYVMTRLPGRIKREIKVDLPRPRDHQIMVTPEFMNLKRQVVELLWEESKAAAEDVCLG